MELERFFFVIKVKKEASSRLVQGQSKSPPDLAAHFLFHVHWEALSPNS